MEDETKIELPSEQEGKWLFSIDELRFGPSANTTQLMPASNKTEKQQQLFKWRPSSNTSTVKQHSLYKAHLSMGLPGLGLPL